MPAKPVKTEKSSLAIAEVMQSVIRKWSNVLLSLHRGERAEQFLMEASPNCVTLFYVLTCLEELDTFMHIEF